MHFGRVIRTFLNNARRGVHATHAGHTAQARTKQVHSHKLFSPPPPEFRGGYKYRATFRVGTGGR